MPDPNPQQPGGKHELFGIPLWGYAAALGAFLVAVFVIYRQQSGSSSGQTQFVPTASPYPPYPFSTQSGSTSQTPSQQQAGRMYPPDLSQWDIKNGRFFPNPSNLPPGWAWGQSGAYTVGGGPAYGHFIWTGSGWLPNTDNPPPDWITVNAPPHTINSNINSATMPAAIGTSGGP